MKVDVSVRGPLRDVGREAHRLDVGTGIAVAFARNPMKVRRQLAFYGSTPAYRPVLDHHGWGDLQTELHESARQSKWDNMGDLIDADVLDAFVVVGAPDAIAGLVAARYGSAVAQVRQGFSAQHCSDRVR